jgi:3-mercaptopyruvate sulfurtransferase SseA
MKEVDVRKNDIVVVYDKIGKVSAPRAFWLLKYFGLPNVMILNGSFAKWQSEGRSIEEGDKASAWKRERKDDSSDSDFQFAASPKNLRKYEEIVKISQ